MRKRIEIIQGSNSRKILMDISSPKKINNKLVVFSHGFKGFKDWGCFPLISQYFTKNRFVFIKFNFSHNGTTISNPLNFDDLEAFGNNNFSKELNDLGFVLDWVESEFTSFEIILLGHSRGGGISMLKAGEDKRIKKVISWASPSDFLNRILDSPVKMWKKMGVAFVYNGRTKQNMPLYLQFYNDCFENKNRLNIEKSVSSLSIPQLIIHGDSDPTVLLNEAENLHKWNPNSELFILKGSDHVFGASHPYNSELLPVDLKKAVDKTIEFINQ